MIARAAGAGADVAGVAAVVGAAGGDTLGKGGGNLPVIELRGLTAISKASAPGEEGEEVGTEAGADELDSVDSRAGDATTSVDDDATSDVAVPLGDAEEEE